MHSCRWVHSASIPFLFFRRWRSRAVLPRTCMDLSVPCTARRTFLVRFHETPNEACYKFFVDGVEFLPSDHGNTLRFDLDNCFQSPLAEHVLRSLPMVEEVTIGRNFITVRRVDDDDADAAVRHFTRKVGASTVSTSEVAQHSAALQQHVVDAMMEEKEDDDRTPLKSRGWGSINDEQHPQQEETVEEEVEGKPKEDLDETAALRELVVATHWSELKFYVSGLLTDHLFSGRPHLDPAAPHPHPDTLPRQGDSEVMLMLKELIANTIRPQLQLDGGDIRLVCLDGAVLYVEMLGACRKCKSSKTTLRDLIERTTRHWIPEVQEVRDVEEGTSPVQRLKASQRCHDVMED